MYTYTLTTNQAHRINLDEKASNDGYDDARQHYPDPNTVLTGRDLTDHANSLVDLALDYVDDLTDDPEEYRARYVDAYCKSYREQIQDLTEEERDHLG